MGVETSLTFAGCACVLFSSSHEQFCRKRQDAPHPLLDETLPRFIPGAFQLQGAEPIGHISFKGRYLYDVRKIVWFFYPPPCRVHNSLNLVHCGRTISMPHPQAWGAAAPWRCIHLPHEYIRIKKVHDWAMLHAAARLVFLWWQFSGRLRAKTRLPCRIKRS